MCANEMDISSHCQPGQILYRNLILTWQLHLEGSLSSATFENNKTFDQLQKFCLFIGRCLELLSQKRPQIETDIMLIFIILRYEKGHRVLFRPRGEGGGKGPQRFSSITLRAFELILWNFGDFS